MFAVQPMHRAPIIPSTLKYTYNTDGKRINGYLKTTDTSLFEDIKMKIERTLFVEHKLPSGENRFYWIDEDSDEIDIVTQSDFDIFVEKSKERWHLLVAPKNKESNTETNIPKAQDAPTSTGAAGPRQPPPADASNNPNSVHIGVECDSCLMCPIVGFRYKCLQCPNFDICQNCEAKHAHGDHMMVRMPNNNCPYVVDAWVTGGGMGCGRKSGRKHHEKRCKSGGMPPFGFNFASPMAANGETESEKPKEGGRRHGRRSARHNFLSHLYEMMHDLAEGGGAAAAATAMGETPENTTTKTTTSSTTTSSNPPGEDNPVAKAAFDAAQKAHAAAVSAAEIAAKVAHQTALDAARKSISENPSTSAAAAAAEQANEKTQTSSSTTTTTTTPNASQTPTMSAAPSLQDFVQLLDPKLLRGGMEILNNFNDMFAKMLDPMDTAEGGETSNCPIAENIRRSSQQSSNSNNSKICKTVSKEGEKKTPEAAVNSLLDISDLGSDSESDSVSESFIKLNAPSKENTPETAADATPSTPNTSTASTPPKSLDKSNVMDFAQLSADLKAHIAQEEEKTNTPTKPADVEMRAVPVFKETETEAAQAKQPEESRAVPVYHDNPRINHSVLAMMSMGFSNEGAWLTQLLESVNGNIPEALDLISATQRNSQ
uniref:Putative pb1 domain protein n=1 Tax=Haematobia irritans TaxID=7368 RepID=A0A1L8EEH7_HAEIR